MVEEGGKMKCYQSGLYCLKQASRDIQKKTGFCWDHEFRSPLFPFLGLVMEHEKF